jgi:SAM-dependent methyltransferase
LATKWQKEIPEKYSLSGEVNAIHVDLGCGNLPRNPLKAGKVIGLDVSSEPPFPVQIGTIEYLQVSPGGRLPFESNQIHSVSAFDFLEHIPRSDRTPAGEFTNPFINIMNEIYRILKPGGIFLALTPCYPSPAAFIDPTHVNFIGETTHFYFSGPNHAKVKNYGFTGDFICIEAAWSDDVGVIWGTYVNLDQPTELGAGAKPELGAGAKPELGAGVKLNRYIEILRSLRRKFLFKLRKPLIGHSGETHFLWVLQKPYET